MSNDVLLGFMVFSQPTSKDKAVPASTALFDTAEEAVTWARGSNAQSRELPGFAEKRFVICEMRDEGRRVGSPGYQIAVPVGYPVATVLPSTQMAVLLDLSAPASEVTQG